MRKHHSTQDWHTRFEIWIERPWIDWNIWLTYARGKGFENPISKLQRRYFFAFLHFEFVFCISLMIFFDFLLMIRPKIVLITKLNVHHFHSASMILTAGQFLLHESASTMPFSFFIVFPNERNQIMPNRLIGPNNFSNWIYKNVNVINPVIARTQWLQQYKPSKHYFLDRIYQYWRNYIHLSANFVYHTTNL